MRTSLSWIRRARTRVNITLKYSGISFAMASGMARCAINAVLEDMRLKALSPRIEKVLQLGESIMGRITASETDATTFDDFSIEMSSILRGTVQSAGILAALFAVKEISCGPLSTRRACCNSLRCGISFSLH